MKLAISNLAWNSSDLDILTNLVGMGVFNIEGVPTKIDHWDRLDVQSMVKFKHYLDIHSVEMPSMQSLFYQTDCTSFFEQEHILAHFERLVSYCKILSTKILVLGSPKLRTNAQDPYTKLATLFSRLDSMIHGTGVTIVIEPNASIYGGSFFFTIQEIVEFIQENNLRNIRTMVDTHNSHLQLQDPIVEFNKYFEYISHIHISECGLRPIEDSMFHRQFAKALHQSTYAGIVTYEVLSCPNILEEIQTFTRLYK